MLFVPRNNGGYGALEDNTTSTSAFGTLVTASGTIHTKGSYATLIAATSFESFGITIMPHGVAAAGVNSRMLIDIAVGAAASESVVIANLIAGNCPSIFGQGHTGYYYFPLYIPAGVRVSARCQGLISADTVQLNVWLHQQPGGPGSWFGQRVTTYGANTATSSGVSHTPGGSNAYGTATEITSSCTNPVKFLQVGMDIGTATNIVDDMGLLEIGLGATPNYVVNDLPWIQNTAVDSVNLGYVNAMLAQQRFNIPAATRLVVNSMNVAVSPAARGVVFYGVD